MSNAFNPNVSTQNILYNRVITKSRNDYRRSHPIARAATIPLKAIGVDLPEDAALSKAGSPAFAVMEDDTPTMLLCWGGLTAKVVAAGDSPGTVTTLVTVELVYAMLVVVTVQGT